ncbi:putative transcriptional regulator, LysR family [Vibrio nigripulchritudo MADA3029]|uniref:LysR family transcriptional regulator n=1 Tax=Vibrio nigripulchritudo TaxID=28173 RepID=UPI0003B180D9|nr:LysR family transcriptional regulator [Vibrio nigripulchritudo]CCN49941.1 putative transcriptional regulator, LysR family [Vibrio nigripulchritudo MADA3020]CCN56417.1 putative transcriptional regulator, LysR family [Vibrio nigripulchritudo MADA3021]CCN62090.1 putative transcriptional regulator, LysR family [Vibrio nigripulchritudo MADA3029]
MNIDWQWINHFLVVAEQGSLSKAAELLGLSQPTLTRQVQRLEKELGYALFERSTQGLNLTENGHALIQSAQGMSDAADHFLRSAQGNKEELKGTVRISVNELFGHFLLPPALVAFREHNPSIEFEIVISNEASNLSKRDADIAVRMFRHKQHDLVSRVLPSIPLGFYVHQSYIEKHGLPDLLQTLSEHQIIGFDRFTSFIDEARLHGFELSPNDFSFRSDSLMQHWQLLNQGAGIAATHKGLAEKNPDLVQVLPDMPISELPCHLMVHQDIQTNTKVRTLLNFLGDWFEKHGYKYID